MPALPTVVSDYLTTLKGALQQGSDLGQNVQGASKNYLLTQDLASVLDLLQQALTQTTPLTSTGAGTTTTVVDGASTFVAGTQVGNVVTFTGNITAALAGVEARVVSNTTTTLTFGTTLPAAPQLNDTYTIRGALFDDHVALLRGSGGAADAVLTGNPWGYSQQTVGAFLLGIKTITGTAAAERVMASLVCGTGSTTTNLVVDTTNTGEMRIDAFKDLNATVSGATRKVLTNDETTITLTAPLGSAPTASTAISLTKSFDNLGLRGIGSEAGTGPILADLMNQLQVAIVAFTLPT